MAIYLITGRFVVDVERRCVVGYTDAGKLQQQKEKRMANKAELVEKLKAKGATHAVIVAAKAKLNGR